MRKRFACINDMPIRPEDRRCSGHICTNSLGKLRSRGLKLPGQLCGTPCNNIRRKAATL